MSETINDDTTETIGTFQMDGRTYQLDHLGIGLDSQWGEFAIYRDGAFVDCFAIPDSALRPEFRPASLPPLADLIELAKAAVQS